MMLSRIVGMLSLAGLLATAGQAAVIFELTPPGGAIAGLPGSTIGWGFTLTSTEDFLVVTGAEFTPAPLSSFGSFEDFISTGPLLVIGPAPESPTLTQGFDATLRLGVGAFHLAPTAAGSVSGSLVLHYALF